MTIRKTAGFLAIAIAGLAGTADATVILGNQAGPIAGATNTLDFDNPFYASGLYSGNAFASRGFSDFSLIGTWNNVGDSISSGSNDSGQSLVSQNGQLAVAGLGQALDDVQPGGGLEVTLSQAAVAFSWLFIDQINFNYQVELFDGASSLGTALAGYNGSYPVPENQVTADGSQFDRVVITFTATTGGVGFDNFAYAAVPAAVPAPAPIALLGIGGLAMFARRRRRCG